MQASLLLLTFTFRLCVRGWVKKQSMWTSCRAVRELWLQNCSPLCVQKSEMRYVCFLQQMFEIFPLENWVHLRFRSLKSSRFTAIYTVHYETTFLQDWCNTSNSKCKEDSVINQQDKTTNSTVSKSCYSTIWIIRNSSHQCLFHLLKWGKCFRKPKQRSFSPQD